MNEIVMHVCASKNETGQLNALFIEALAAPIASTFRIVSDLAKIL